MRSLLRSVVQRKDGGLVGRTLKVGPYTCKVEAHLGDGGSATIYRVRDNSSGAAYALKHIRLAGEADARADCETEVETMKRLRGHPNILTLRAVALAGPKGAEQEAFLLLDLCRDSLPGYLAERGGQLGDGDVLTIFHAAAKAVAVMHHQSPPLAHRRASQRPSGCACAGARALRGPGASPLPGRAAGTSRPRMCCCTATAPGCSATLVARRRGRARTTAPTRCWWRRSTSASTPRPRTGPRRRAARRAAGGRPLARAARPAR